MRYSGSRFMLRAYGHKKGRNRVIRPFVTVARYVVADTAFIVNTVDILITPIRHQSATTPMLFAQQVIRALEREAG